MDTKTKRKIAALLTLVIGIFLYPADPEPQPPGEYKGYHILEADLHTHSFIAGAFPMPWDIVEMSRKQKILSFIANPNIAVLLGLIGLGGLYLEFSNPGTARQQ